MYKVVKISKVWKKTQGDTKTTQKSFTSYWCPDGCNASLEKKKNAWSYMKMFWVSILSWGDFKNKGYTWRLSYTRKWCVTLITCVVVLARIKWFTWGFPSFPFVYLSPAGHSCVPYKYLSVHGYVMYVGSHYLYCLYILRKMWWCMTVVIYAWFSLNQLLLH